MQDDLRMLLPIISKEMTFARREFGPYHNAHELEGVMREEYEEWWDSVKANQENDYELLQLASVILRYLIQRGNFTEIEIMQEERWL
jgi:hypothetical protein